MQSHLSFFELDRSPFVDDDRAPLVLGTPAMRQTFAAIREAVDGGQSRICVQGPAGVGRTRLARALPQLFDETAHVAVVLDPSRPWPDLRAPIARQWQLSEGGLGRARLIEAARERRLVLVVDAAERADEEFLDHLDVLLGLPDESGEPIVQGLLLARSDAPSAPVHAWIDRVGGQTIDYPPMPRAFLGRYLERRLARAGARDASPFTDEALDAIYARTGGLPGEVSELCERLLIQAAEQEQRTIDATAVASLCSADATQAASPVSAALAAPAKPEETFDPLLAPPTRQELRQIRGSWLRRHGWLVAGSLLAVGLGAFVLSFWMDADGGDASSVAEAVRRDRARPGAATVDAESLGFEPGGWVMPDGKLRGPAEPSERSTGPASR